MDSFQNNLYCRYRDNTRQNLYSKQRYRLKEQHSANSMFVILEQTDFCSDGSTASTPDGKRIVDHCQPTDGKAGGPLAFCSAFSGRPTGG